MTSPNLVWVSQYCNPTGYGEEARGFIGTLDRGLFNLKIIPAFSYAVEGILAPEQEARLAFWKKTRSTQQKPWSYSTAPLSSSIRISGAG